MEITKYLSVILSNTQLFNFTLLLAFDFVPSGVQYIVMYLWKSILTNSPWRGPVHPWRGPQFPLAGTGTPPGGLVLFFQYMQLYLITNTPWQGPVHPCGGPQFPLAGTGTPPGGLVLSLQYLQLSLVGLADGLLSINPSPQVTTFIIGQLDPKCMFNSIIYVRVDGI